MKVIVAGGRDFKNYRLLKSTLDNFQQEYGNITEVISGTAKGVDTLGEKYALENNIPIKRFIPDWKGLGKKAGHVRNRQMGDYAKENDGFLIACWNGESKGTKGMIDYAKNIGLPFKIVFYIKDSECDE